jgi:epoxyqueuosine reductase
MLQEYSMELEKYNSKFGIIDINRIMELQEEINSKRNLPFLGHNHYIDDYNFETYRNEKSINSIFIIATPSPFYILRVKYLEKDIDLIIPPIYGNKNEVHENIKNVNKNILGKYGFSAFPVMLPKKLLAVHSGLAKYGNNGLVYVKGMGSYCRLTAFASDFKDNNYTWVKPSMLESCKSCGKCVENCPSNALEHGPWVNINKCITEYNEKDGIFPDWLRHEWHNCLVGCRRCQEICPHNSGKKQTIIVQMEYSEIEDIINSKEFDDLSEKNKATLKELNIDRFYIQLKRNIKCLIN